MKSSKETTFDGVDSDFIANLSGDRSLSYEEVDALISDIEKEIERDVGLMSYVRSLPTPIRVGLGVVISALATVMVAVWLPGKDLWMVPIERLVSTLGAISILLGASVWYSLRPLHRPPMPWGFHPLIVCVSLASMVVLAYWPLTVPLPDAPEDWTHAVGCLYAGVLLGLPAYLVLRSLDRGGRSASAFLSASAAALSANAALAMHCENTSAGHLVRGHAALGLVFVGVVAIWRWLILRLLPR